MAIIAARKPYYITQNTTDLQIRIRSYAVIDPGGWQHTIEKASYGEDPEDLSINVSPYIRPYFVHTPQVTPTTAAGTATGEWLNVVIEVNGVEETHSAVNGYLAPIDEAYYDRWQVTKRVHRGTDSYITIPGYDVTATYTCDDGQTDTIQTGSSSRPRIIPVQHSAIDYSTVFKQSIQVGVYTYNYEFVCPYETGTIGFVNAVGMWEYFDINGAQEYVRTREQTEYVPFSTGEWRTINVNGERRVRVNTGWITHDWSRRIMTDFIVSEYHIWHKGSSWDWLKLDTTASEELRDPTTKMKNHTFEFTYAAPAIPII